jgi:hypothetical protein
MKMKNCKEPANEQQICDGNKEYNSKNPITIEKSYKISSV